MKTVQRKKKSIFFSIAHRSVIITLLILIIVLGCSKSDPGPDPFVELDPTPNNTNNNSGNSEVGEVNVSIKSIAPETPATLKFGDSIAITYDYEVTRAAGARIWIQPYTDDELSSTGIYSLSPVFKGNGTKTVHISITEGDTVKVDQLRTQVNTPGFILLGVLTGSSLISESFEPVDYTFTN